MAHGAEPWASRRGTGTAPGHSPLQPHSALRRRRGAASIARGAGQQQAKVFLPSLSSGSKCCRLGLSPSGCQPRPQPFLKPCKNRPRPSRQRGISRGGFSFCSKFSSHPALQPLAQETCRAPAASHPPAASGRRRCPETHPDLALARLSPHPIRPRCRLPGCRQVPHVPASRNPPEQGDLIPSVPRGCMQGEDRLPSRPSSPQTPRGAPGRNRS